MEDDSFISYSLSKPPGTALDVTTETAQKIGSKHADERISLAKQKKKSLEKATKDALLLYKSGMVTYLEVIVAQNNALQNELELELSKRINCMLLLIYTELLVEE